MANFSTIGVRLLLKDLGPFVAQMQAARRQISLVGSRGISSVGKSASAGSQSVTGFSNRISTASQTVREFGDKIVTSSAKIRNFGNELTATGFRLGLITAGLAGVQVASVRAASTFEESLVRIINLTDLSAEGAREFGDAILDIAGSVGQLPTELADAGYFITSTGISNVKVARDILVSSARASAIGLGEVETVARAVTATVSAYGSSNITAAEAVDTLAAAVRRGNFEASEIAPVLNKVLPIASALGVSFSEASAFMATFTISGASASVAATALQRTLTSIEKPSSQAREAFAKLGFVVDDTRNEFKAFVQEEGLTAALIELRRRADESNVSLSRIFGRVTALTGVLFVTSDAAKKRFLDNLALIKSSAGLVDAAFENVTKTTAFQFNQLKAEIQATAIIVGRVLLPAVNILIERVGTFAGAIARVAAERPKIVLYAAAFTLLLGAITPIIITAGLLISALGSIGTVIGTVIGLFGSLIGTTGLAVTAIGTVFGLYLFSLGEIRKRQADTAAQIENRFGAFNDKIQQLSARGSKRVADNYDEMGDKIAQKAAQLQQSSFGWGANIIIQFAKGMAAAAIAVVNVLIQIGQMISNLLRANSPPKLLPDLPEWGRSAMNEWLKGWTSADFSVFSNISGIVESFFRGLGSDAIGEKDLIPTILGSREALQEAIRQWDEIGSVTDEVLNNISGKFGATSAAIREYVVTMLQLRDASEEVARTQEEIDQINQRFDDQLGPLNSELQDIADRRQDIADQMRTEELEAIVSDENAPALTKELALMELREIELKKQIRDTEDQRDSELELAEQRLEAARAEEERLQEQADAQRAYIEMQTRTNSLLSEQTSILDRLADKLKEIGGIGGGAGGGVGGIGDFDFENSGLAEVGELIPSIGADISESVNDLIGDFKNLAEEIKKPFEPLLGDDGLLNQLRDTWASVFSEIDLPALATDILAVTLAVILFKTAMKGLVISGAIGSIIASIGGAGGLLGLLKSLKTEFGLLTLSVGAGGLKGKLLVIAGLLGGPVGVAALAAAVAVGALLIKFGGFKGAADAVRKTFTGSGTFGPNGIFFHTFDLLGEKVGDWASDTWQSFVDWNEDVNDEFSNWRDTTNPLIDEWISDKVDKFGAWASDTWQSFVDWNEDVNETLSTWAEDTNAAFDTWYTDTTEKVGDTVAEWVRLIGTAVTDFFDTGKAVMDAFGDGLEAKVEELKGIIRGIFGKLKSLWDELVGGLDLPGGGGSSGASSAQGTGKFSNMFSNAINRAASIVPVVNGSPIAAPASASVGSVVDNRVGAHISNVNINNGMDLATFKVVVEDIVSEML